MSSLKTFRPGALDAPRPAGEAARRAFAAGLRSASAALARLSRRLAPPLSRAAQPVPRLEFYAEAGAPEGALYLDGQLVGWVPGVSRL
jgi:hypothetical protein